MGLISRPDHHVVVLLCLKVLVHELFGLLPYVASKDHVIKPLLVLPLEWDLSDSDLCPSEAIDAVLLVTWILWLVREIPGMARKDADVDLPDVLGASQLLDTPDV